MPMVLFPKSSHMPELDSVPSSFLPWGFLWKIPPILVLFGSTVFLLLILSFGTYAPFDHVTMSSCSV